jgi:hypothetical protein
LITSTPTHLTEQQVRDRGFQHKLQPPNHTWTQERIESFDRVLDSMHSDGDDEWHLAFQTGGSAGQVQNLSYFKAHHDVFENAVTTAQVEALFPKAIGKCRERERGLSVKHKRSRCKWEASVCEKSNRRRQATRGSANKRATRLACRGIEPAALMIIISSPSHTSTITNNGRLSDLRFAEQIQGKRSGGRGVVIKPATALEAGLAHLAMNLHHFYRYFRLILRPLLCVPSSAVDLHLTMRNTV